MKKISLLVFTVAMLLCSMCSAAATGAATDGLRTALNQWKNPEGHYTFNMNIKFAMLGNLISDNVMDLQASPFCMRNVNHTSMGKPGQQTASERTSYEVQEGHQLKNYTEETKGSGANATKYWTYEYSPIEGGGNALDNLQPASLLNGVKAVTLRSNDGTTQVYDVTFDCAKVFETAGAKTSLAASDAGKSQKVFDDVFKKLQKSGDVPAVVTVVNGKITHANMDITKPVKAFDKVIVADLNKGSHGGALGGWILGRLFATGESTMTLTAGPARERISVPASVVNSAVPAKTTTTKK